MTLGGYSCEFLVEVCRPVLQILTPFQTKICHFPHPCSDRASKIHTLFQTCPLRNYVIIALIRRPTKGFLKSHFEFAYYPFYFIHLKQRWKIRSYTPVVPSKTKTRFRQKWAKSIPVFRPKWRKNHTIWGDKYLYSLYKPPPPPHPPFILILAQTVITVCIIWDVKRFI